MFSVNNKFTVFIFIVFSVYTDIGRAAVANDLESIDPNNAGDRVDKDMMEIQGRGGPFHIIQGLAGIFSNIFSNNLLNSSETTTTSGSVDIVDTAGTVDIVDESTTSKNEEPTTGPSNVDDKDNKEQTDKETGEEQKASDRDSCPPS